MRPPPIKTRAVMRGYSCADCPRSCSCQSSARIVGSPKQAFDISLGVRSRDDPVQTIGRRHVDAALEQAMNEARVQRGISVAAIVAIVVDDITVSEVNLEHGAESLHDRLEVVAAEDLAQASDGGVANGIELLMSAWSGK